MCTFYWWGKCFFFFKSIAERCYRTSLSCIQNIITAPWILFLSSTATVQEYRSVSSFAAKQFMAISCVYVVIKWTLQKVFKSLALLLRYSPNICQYCERPTSHTTQFNFNIWRTFNVRPSTDKVLFHCTQLILQYSVEFHSVVMGWLCGNHITSDLLAFASKTKHILFLALSLALLKTQKTRHLVCETRSQQSYKKFHI